MHSTSLTVRTISITLLLLMAGNPLFAFTQSGVGAAGVGYVVPMGHEWLTRRAAIELLFKYDPFYPYDKADPRTKWRRGKAKNLTRDAAAHREIARIQLAKTDENRYHSIYTAVYDAIVGERWVDIGGYSLAEALGCWDAVAQQPANVQYDHFMRRYDDAYGQGGVDAATRSRERFIRYFVAAAMAPSARMIVLDGGVEAMEAEVESNYFFFGRAVHLFQDSFSPEHTVRIEKDGYESVRQVKSYLCALGSQQHSHSNDAVLHYVSGDVVWIENTRTDDYKPSLMKPHALVALEATKDLWAAFFRTMGMPREQREAVAQKEAQALAKNWLSFDENEMRTWYQDVARRTDGTWIWSEKENYGGNTQAACMIALGIASGSQQERVDAIARTRGDCLDRTNPVRGYSDLWDLQLHLPYYWLEVPAGAVHGGGNVADSGRHVRLRSVWKNQFLTGKVGSREELRVADGVPVDFTQVSTVNGVFFRVRWAPRLFLSYTGTSDGTAMLWEGTRDSSYSMSGRDVATIMNIAWKQYLWVDEDGSVHVTSAGDPTKPNTVWEIVQQP